MHNCWIMSVLIRQHNNGLITLPDRQLPAKCLCQDFGLEHVARLSVSNQMAVEDEKLVEASRDLAQIVRCQHHRYAVHAQFVKDLKQLPLPQGVDTAEWFVQQQNSCALREGTRNEHAPLLPAG